MSACLSENHYINEKVFYSTRSYAERLSDNQWVLFSPDHVGGPIVVSNFVYSLLQSFKNGAYVEDIITMLKDLSGYTYEQLFYCIVSLFNRGILVREKPSDRYRAEDTIQKEDISTVEVWMHITNYCNLQCSYCFVHKSKEIMNQATMDNTIKNLVFTAKKNKIKLMKLKFAGGEATLVTKNIKYMHFKLKEELEKVGTQLRSVILTNGTIFTDELTDFILQENIDIGISLDGYGPEGHDIYRVYKNNEEKGSWDVIIKNIQKFLDLGIKPGIMATISEESCGTLTDLVAWINKNDLLSRLSIVREPSALRDKTKPINIAEAYSSMCDTMIDAFEKAFCELEKPEYSARLLKKMNICELHFSEPAFSTCCGIGGHHIVIRDDGNLTNCPMTLQEKAVMPKNDLLADIRKTFPRSPLERNEKKEKNCLDCNWFPVCVGGCPVNNDRNMGDPFAISPLHKFYQYVIPRYIKFYGQKLLQHAQLNNIANNLILCFD